MTEQANRVRIKKNWLQGVVPRRAGLEHEAAPLIPRADSFNLEASNLQTGGGLDDASEPRPRLCQPDTGINLLWYESNGSVL
jgi:hypothetical protein